MPLRLTDTQLAEYRDLGFTAPVRIMSTEEAATHRAELEAYEATLGRPVNYPEKSKCHMLFNWADTIVHNPILLDALEDLIGPDILLFHFTLQTKEAHRQTHAQWHQDDAYFRLDPAAQVTAWVALSEASESSGALRMIPESHKRGLADHNDNVDPDSIIGRPQEVLGYGPKDGVLVPLQPGEMSLHHTHTLHASGPNDSDDRRIGLTLSYIPTHVRPTGDIRPSALLMRGQDKYGYYETETRLDPSSSPEVRRQAHFRSAGLYYKLSGTSAQVAGAAAA